MTSPKLERLAASTRTEAEAMAERCPECKGWGWLDKHSDGTGPLCPTCNGTGKRKEPET